MNGRPKFWRVSWGSEFLDFTERSRARGFVLMQRARGIIATIGAH